MAWGSEIDGLDDGEAKVVDQAAVAFLKPSCRGRSLTAVLLMHGWPSWRASAAPALRWAKEVWNATTAKDNEVRGTMSPKEFVGLYKTARLEKCFGWRQVRGPISACKLSLARLGWKWPGPFTFVSGDGVEVKLGESSPAAVGKLIYASAIKHLQRKLARECKDSAFEDKIVSHEFAMGMMKSKDLDNDEKRSLGIAFCGALWTRTRARDSGYEVPSVMCPLCAQDEDSVFHRAWKCTQPAVKAARNSCAPDWAQRAARNEGKTRCCSLGRGFLLTPRLCQNLSQKAAW